MRTDFMLGIADKGIIIEFETPGDIGREMFKLKCAYDQLPRQQWTRQPNESEQDFVDCAKKEVKRNEYGVAKLFQED
jgi:hypothetical protein